MLKAITLNLQESVDVKKTFGCIQRAIQLKELVEKRKTIEMVIESAGFWSFNIRMAQKEGSRKKYDAFYNTMKHELIELRNDPENMDYETLFTYAPANCLILRFLPQKIIKVVNPGTIKDDQTGFSPFIWSPFFNSLCQ